MKSEAEVERESQQKQTDKEAQLDKQFRDIQDLITTHFDKGACTYVGPLLHWKVKDALTKLGYTAIMDTTEFRHPSCSHFHITWPVIMSTSPGSI